MEKWKLEDGSPEQAIIEDVCKFYQWFYYADDTRDCWEMMADISAGLCKRHNNHPLLAELINKVYQYFEDPENRKERTDGR
jgi:hypothetical protein